MARFRRNSEGSEVVAPKASSTHDDTFCSTTNNRLRPRLSRRRSISELYSSARLLDRHLALAALPHAGPGVQNASIVTNAPTRNPSAADSLGFSPSSIHGSSNALRSTRRPSLSSPLDRELHPVPSSSDKSTASTSTNSASIDSIITVTDPTDHDLHFGSEGEVPVDAFGSWPTSYLPLRRSRHKSWSSSMNLRPSMTTNAGPSSIDGYMPHQTQIDKVKAADPNVQCLEDHVNDLWHANSNNAALHTIDKLENDFIALKSHDTGCTHTQSTSTHVKPQQPFNTQIGSEHKVKNRRPAESEKPVAIYHKVLPAVPFDTESSAKATSCCPTLSDARSVSRRAIADTQGFPARMSSPLMKERPCSATRSRPREVIHTLIRDLESLDRPIDWDYPKATASGVHNPRQVKFQKREHKKSKSVLNVSAASAPVEASSRGRPSQSSSELQDRSVIPVDPILKGSSNTQPQTRTMLHHPDEGLRIPSNSVIPLSSGPLSSKVAGPHQATDLRDRESINSTTASPGGISNHKIGPIDDYDARMVAIRSHTKTECFPNPTQSSDSGKNDLFVTRKEITDAYEPSAIRDEADSIRRALEEAIRNRSEAHQLVQRLRVDLIQSLQHLSKMPNADAGTESRRPRNVEAAVLHDYGQHAPDPPKRDRLFQEAGRNTVAPWDQLLPDESGTTLPSTSLDLSLMRDHQKSLLHPLAADRPISIHLIPQLQPPSTKFLSQRSPARQSATSSSYRQSRLMPRSNAELCTAGEVFDRTFGPRLPYALYGAGSRNSSSRRNSSFPPTNERSPTNGPDSKRSLMEEHPYFEQRSLARPSSTGQDIWVMEATRTDQVRGGQSRTDQGSHADQALPIKRTLSSALESRLNNPSPHSKEAHLIPDTAYIKAGTSLEFDPRSEVDPKLEFYQGPELDTSSSRPPRVRFEIAPARSAIDRRPF